MDELEDGAVFRLAFINSDFPPGSAHINVAHLRPSPRDIEHAKRTGKDVLVSVFEVGRTTVDQAQAIRGLPTPSEAFKFDVHSIRQIGNEQWPQVFQVFCDPLEPPSSLLPGADGHCGIKGLEPAPGLPAKLFKEFRARLAKLSLPYRDSE